MSVSHHVSISDDMLCWLSGNHHGTTFRGHLCSEIMEYLSPVLYKSIISERYDYNIILFPSLIAAATQVFLLLIFQIIFSAKGPEV